VAMAMKSYARQAKNRKLENDAVEIRLRAERRLGEMIAAQGESKAKGAREKGTKRGTTRVSGKPASLAETGIDKNLAHRARWLARLTDEQFKEAVEDAQERGARLGLRVRRRPTRSSPAPQVEDVPLPPHDRLQTWKDFAIPANIAAVDLGRLLDDWGKELTAAERKELITWTQEAAERWTKLVERLEKER